MYVEEIGIGARSIEGVSTSTIAFIGEALSGPMLQPILIDSWKAFESKFGGLKRDPILYLGYAVQAFFHNQGKRAMIVRVAGEATNITPDATEKKVVDTIRRNEIPDPMIFPELRVNVEARAISYLQGLSSLEEVEGISLVAIPGETTKEIQQALIDHCEKMSYRFAILDSVKMTGPNPSQSISTQRGALLSPGGFAALYHPWVQTIDQGSQEHIMIPPCGAVAGVFARNDVERGVHKAPANIALKGIVGLENVVTPSEQKLLNTKGINVIRTFPGRGILLWGARTIANDPSWRFVNTRRLMIFLEESIYRGTQWVIFEPNDERLWSRVRQSVTEFLTKVWKDGGLMGRKTEEAFFVRCDRSTMTQNDIDHGNLIILIGVAPIKSAEFMIFRIGHRSSG